MNKTTPGPPEDWPLEAQALYQEYECSLRRRLVSAGRLLLALWRCFRLQRAQGLDFRDFPASFLDLYLAPKASRERAGALRSWLRFLFARGELLLPLHDNVCVPKASRPYPRVLSPQQIQAVLELPRLDEPWGLRDRAYLEMAYSTGLRKSELAALDLGDVDLVEGLVFVRQSKNCHQRSLPLTRWALHFVKLYLEQARPKLASQWSQNALWLGKNGRRLFPDTVRLRLNQVYQVKQVLGFSITLQQIRHACATHLLEGGAELRQVQELLGHLALSSTKIYTHITPTRLRQVHLRCHPRNKGEGHF